MKVIEAATYQLLAHLPLVCILLFVVAVLPLLAGTRKGRGASAQWSSLVDWFSQLHANSWNLGESSYPRDVVESALSETLRTLHVSHGLALLQGDYGESTSHVASRRLSSSAVAVLSAEPLRRYLASASERWGNLLLVPGLDKTELLEEWQRGPEFRDVIATMKAEGLKSLLIIGLVTRGRTYGALLVGWRRRKTFKSKELLVAAAIGNQVSVTLDNWSLVRAGQRHDEDLRTLDRVGRAMREIFNLHEQMATLRQNMSGLLGGLDFALAMQDTPEGPMKTIVPFEHFKDAGEIGATPSSLLEEVAKSRVARLNVEGWQWAKYPSNIAAEAPQVRTWCGAPFHFSDGSMGVLEAANFERERGISVEQFELVRVLANEAAGAFENARTFQKEQRRARHLALLNAMGRKATSFLDPRELLANVCAQVREVFGHDLARVEIWDRKSDELVVEAEAGYGGELIGHHTPVYEGFAGAAAARHEPVVSNWIRGGPELSTLAPGVRSSVSLSLEYQNELFGVLTLESRSVQAFPEQDVLMLKTLADQVSIALHNARKYQNALEEAITDGLTGLKTHRYFMEALERELRRSQRTGRHFSVIMMDLDQFKLVNDQHGHSEGDAVLSGVAKLLTTQVRQSCVLARYGGDEFSILLPDANVQDAERAAERLRENIEHDPLLATRHITGSFGIATYPEHGTTHREILDLADSGMYLAKHKNGNRVCIATRVPSSGQVQAYLGVEFKRKFFTGPDVFNAFLNRLEKSMKAEGDIQVVDMVTSLARTIDLSDPYTRYHSRGVSRVASQISFQLRLPVEEAAGIRRAAILHDIGKIGIPADILRKPGPLTSSEYAEMQTHTVKGQRILDPLKPTFQHIGLMVRHHHEKFDGRGYPDKLRGDEIPLGARILAVADSFDAMVTKRAYRQARTFEEAIAELLRFSGTQFDPELVRAFLRSIETYGDPRESTRWDGEDSVTLEEALYASTLRPAGEQVAGLVAQEKAGLRLLI